MEHLKNYIRDVPDFPSPGILFRDITPLLAQPAAFAEVVRHLTEAAPSQLTHVAAIEARGFLFAPAVAMALGAGLVPIRKYGKLPCDTVTADYALEYGSDKLALHKDALAAGDKVYLLDDLIATGGSLAAAVELVTACGAAVSKIACLIELTELNGKDKLSPLPLTALLQY